MLAQKEGAPAAHCPCDGNVLTYMDGALSLLLTGVTSAFMCVHRPQPHPSWFPWRQGDGPARADPCRGVPPLEAVGGAGLREQGDAGNACRDQYGNPVTLPELALESGKGARCGAASRHVLGASGKMRQPR